MYKDSTLPDYQPYRYMDSIVYLPVWDGVPMHGYATIGTNYHEPMLVYYLTETSGSSWEIERTQACPGGPCYTYRKVLAKDTAITINNVVYDSVIVVGKYNVSNIGTTGIYDLKYYAKTSGL